ncbi:MAG: formylmethanofuran dehydrogenase [Tissierellia bacterium]|nr:formylmethanofuran dehydrogenase [Tissierellia bacterium]
MNKELWDKCVGFHGHQCPGLAIGFRAAEIAKAKMGLNFSQDEEIVCITENDACGVDAVQVITGCTMGKGNLIFKDTGKMAFTFINRKNGDAIRLMLNLHNREMERDERQRYILEAPEENVFKIENIHIKLPEKARLFNNIICEECNESTAEHKIRIQEGRKLCLDCYDEYTRGW